MFQKSLQQISVLFLILALLLSNWPFGIENAFAANTKIRQEINIIDGVLSATTGTYATSSARIQIDTTSYTSATYYFEIVAKTGSAVSTDVYLRNATTSATVATVTYSNANTYNIYRSSSFTPTSGQHDYVVVIGNSAVAKDVLSARVVILQDATTLVDTQTQIEIGNQELAKTNTTAAALTNPKYWLYDSTKWDPTPTFYAEVTYRNTQVASTTVYTVTATTTAKTSTYIVSSGTSYTVVEAWGAGGGGRGSSSAAGGGGGGGGAYARSTTTLSVGSSHTIVTPAGGVSNSGAAAGDATFDTTTVVADGGISVGASATGAAGGTVANSTGQVEFAGGTGGTANGANDTGGGGGGAAGPNGAGGGGALATPTGTGGGGGGGNGGQNGSGIFGGGSATGGSGGDGGGVSNVNGRSGGHNVNGGGGGGGSGDTAALGGPGGAPGGGGGGSDANNSTTAVGGPGQVRITETHGKVGFCLEEDNGSFGGWTCKFMIADQVVSTSTPARVRTSFTPTTGRNYRITASTTSATAPYDIYNAKIVVDQGYSIVQVGNSLTISTVGSPALAVLSPTQVAFIDDGTPQLRTYTFDGTDWTQTGNALSISTVSSPALAALSSTQVAFIDDNNGQLRTYTFDGTNWTLTGSGLTIATVGSPALATLSSTQVAFIDDSNQQLRTYTFNGSTWSQTGSSLGVSSGFPALAGLSSTQVAFIDGSIDQLRTYTFNGSTWSQTGNSLGVSNGSPALAALTSTRVAFIDSTNDQLRTYTFDGTNWTQTGGSLAISTTGFPALAPLSSTQAAFIDSTNEHLRTYTFDILPTKFEPQYLLANTLFAAGTSLQKFLTTWAPLDWSTTNVYVHEANSVSGGTSDVKLQDSSGSPDVSGSTITDVIEREQSGGMTMPSATTLDVISTSNSNNLYSSRILVQASIVSANTPPTVTLNTPANNSAGQGAYPTFTFTGTDADGDAVAYNIQIDTANTFNTAALRDKVSTTDPGFPAGSPYASGVTQSYTVPATAPLAPGGYYWRVRAIDPSGSNTYGDWSAETRFFNFGEGTASAARSFMKALGGRMNFFGGRLLFK